MSIDLHAPGIWMQQLANLGYAWPDELRLKPEQRPSSLCFVRRGADVLLLQRNYPPFSGRWAAPGGKIEAGEMPVLAAQRELSEETGLHVEQLTFRGLVAESGPVATSNWLLFVFVAHAYSGTLRESGEGPLRWFPRSELGRIGMAPIDLLLQEYTFSDDPPYWAHVEFDAAERVRRLIVEPLSPV